MKNIKDYIGKKVAVECSSEKEWELLLKLTSSEHKNYFNISFNKCFDLEKPGDFWDISSKEDIMENGWTVYPASDFLEEDKSKSLVEKYLKALIDRPQSTSLNKDKYIKIIAKYSKNQYKLEDEWIYTINSETQHHWQLMPEDFSPNEKEWIPKVGDWCVTTTHYNDEIWYKGRIWQIGKIDENGYCIPIKNKKLLEQSLKIGFRKALPHEIPNQYPLTPNKSFQTTIYDFGDIHIPSITKKPKKLQTITIESTTDLNLGLTKIKSKQIQTIKI